MASKRTHDVAAAVGSYEKNGEQKKRYANLGSAFTDEEGRVSIKLDTVPCSPDWNGWLTLFPIKKREGSKPPEPNDDDIPF